MIYSYSEFPNPEEIDFTSKQFLALLSDPEEELLKQQSIKSVDVTIQQSDLADEADNNDFKEYWMPDRLCKVCYCCEDPFTMFRRRHHCRMCGQVFCNQCSSYYIDGTLINLQGLVRCCKLCSEQVNDTKLPKKRLNVSDNNANLQPSLTEVENMRRTASYDVTTFNKKPGNQIASNNIMMYENPVDKAAHVNILQNRASTHLENIVKLLVYESSLKENSDLWEETIISLVREVVSTVDPNVKEGDSIDIRNYVKLKIIPGGNMRESVFIDGIVFRKNISHKKMMYDKNEKDPRILLLSGGIDFQRMDTKLSSIDTLIEQEDKYMEILVDKIMSLKPGTLHSSSCH